MDYERLLNDAAAHYVRIKQQRPNLPPDALVTRIADRVGLDTEPTRGTVEIDEGWCTIQRFVSAMECFGDDNEDVAYPPWSTSGGQDG